MQADLFILQICEFLDDGDGYYRLHEPSRQLSHLPGVVVVDCHYFHHLLPSLVHAADVVVLPFIHDWDFFPVIEQRRAAGRATVFEANDYFYDVQPWSPIGAQWQDRAIREEYRHYMAAADAVQTSTNELARRWRPGARSVAVFKNQLTDVPPLRPTPVRPLTIGWGGSPGHFADWYHAAPVLEHWLNDHPEVHLAVMSNEFARPFIQLPAERYHFTPFGSLPAYLQFLTTLDIGLAPLLHTDYNRCRSDVKFLEYASRGVAGIYADLEPYRETVRPGETGLFYRTSEELRRCLDSLATDTDLRRRIRQQAHDQVSRDRRIGNHINERLAFYRGLVSDSARGFVLSDEVLREAQCQGNYVQLRAGPPEQTLLALSKESASRQAADTLAGLLDRYPNYLAALQHQGQLLNNLQDHRGALHYLKRALTLYPHSARALAEMGRAYFRLQDLGQARRHLEAALEVNPHYFPGWQYLLRLLALSKAADGPTWAERARQLFPSHFGLALAGARTYPPLEAIRLLDGLLNDFASSISPEERPAATAALSEAIGEVAGASLGFPPTMALLQRACEVFPDSARLADLLGRALRLMGHHEEANACFQRALQLGRAAALYRGEYPREDGTIHYWQFADHIKRWTKQENQSPNPTFGERGASAPC